jgi:hypothetical protein
LVSEDSIRPYAIRNRTTSLHSLNSVATMMPDELYDLYRFILEDHWLVDQHDLTVFLRDPEAEDDDPAVIYLQRFAYERKHK